MRIPTSGAYRALRMVVSQRADTYSVTRPTTTTTRFGESDDTSSVTVEVDAWLHEPEEINVDTPYGERLGGDLEGLALPSEDVAVNDEYEHGGETYEVDRIFHLPDNDNPKLKRFSLMRKTNDD